MVSVLILPSSGAV